ncbi:MAG: rRNA pseudouridine synthase [Acholeplasmatales bacterium]|nr:rRNA pseudouridine synthase [Acholeplasmatales bacterium]
MRLDKLLAHMDYGSRKEVKELIRKGYVLVNGNVIKDDDFKVDEFNDEINILDSEIKYEEFIYIMLNKPEGYVSATYDYSKPIVLDLIDDYKKRNLFPVGRLDIDTHGLLLITNDGNLAHRMLSPKSHVDKKYYLKYDGKYNESFIQKFKDGITLDDGYKCMPAEFIDLGDNEAYIIIREGKFHQVKRMMEAVGCNVTFLKRISFGNLVLDESLKEGKWRHLTNEEIESLK